MNKQKKIIIYTALLVTVGCGGNNSVTVTNAPIKKEIKKNTDYDTYLNKINDYSIEREIRIKELEKLNEIGYPYYKELLESLQDDGVVRNDILKISLFYSNFKYSKDNTIRMLQENLENKRYNKFIDIYNHTLDIISRPFYNEREKEFLKTGEEISLKEDIVYNFEQENEEITKIIKKLESKTNKKEIENILQKIEKKKTDLENINKKTDDIKDKIALNIENIQLQKELKNWNEIDLRVKKEKNEMLLKIEELKKQSSVSEIESLKDKIKDNNNKKLEIRADIREKRNKKDEIGKELLRYEENLIASKDELRDFFKNVKYTKENILNSIKLAIKTNEYENFETIMHSYKLYSSKTFEGVKEEWIFEYFTKNREDLVKIKDEINKDNYILFKRSLEEIINNGEDKEKKISVNIILANETDYEKKILSESIELQSEAIKRFGNNKSIEKLKEYKPNKQIREIVILRGFVLAGYNEIFTQLKEKYEKSKEPEYLEVIYILKNNETREYVKLKLKELEDKDKELFFNRKNIYTMAETVDFVFDILLSEEKSSSRMIYLDYISKYNKEKMIKAVLKMIELNRISEREREFIIIKLKENSGEDTTYQILKSLEKIGYSSKLEEEKEKVAFSAKIDFWNNYLSEFPDSLYKEEIFNKISIYEARVETIKSSIKNDYIIQTEQIDKRIQEYKEYIKEQTDLGRIGFFQEKIKELEKRKLQVLKNSKKTTLETIKDLEKKYKNMSDEVQSVTVYLNSKSSDILTREERERQKLDLNKLMVKRAEALEKIAILYGFYLEENKENEGKSILSSDVLRDLKGRR
jgi:hypothetical protein